MIKDVKVSNKCIFVNGVETAAHKSATNLFYFILIYFIAKPFIFMKTNHRNLIFRGLAKVHIVLYSGCKTSMDTANCNFTP